MKIKDNMKIEHKTSEVKDVQNNNLDIKKIFPSYMHPISILDDISYRLDVWAPKYEFNQAEEMCTLQFLDKSWSVRLTNTIQGAKEHVASLACKDVMENMERNLRKKLIKSIKTQENHYQNNIQRTIQPKKFIGKKPKVLSWLNKQVSSTRFKCPCRLLKEFCKSQNLDEPTYNIAKVYNSYIGGVFIGDFYQDAERNTYHESCVREYSSELAFNNLFNQIYEKEYVELNGERKEVYKPWNIYNDEDGENSKDLHTQKDEVGKSNDKDLTNLHDEDEEMSDKDDNDNDKGSEASDDMEYKPINKKKGKGKEKHKEEIINKQQISKEEDGWSDEEYKCPYEIQCTLPPPKSYAALLSDMFDNRDWGKVEYKYEILEGGWYCFIFVKNQFFKSDYCLKKSEAKNSAAKKAYLTFRNA